MFHDSPSSLIVTTNSIPDTPIVSQDNGAVTSNARRQTNGGGRRTPRKCLIVVLAEDHVVSSEQVTARLPREGDGEEIDVILACAGQPRSISALQRKIRDLQVLLAPAGTSTEDLRELAMGQAPGDIVTLLSGAPAVCDDLSENARDDVTVAI